MNILSLGTDRNILSSASESARRHVAYGQHFDELSLVVFTRGKNPVDATLSPGVHAYATHSRSRLLYGVDAFRIAWQLPRPDVVTVQDPFEVGLIGWVIARARGARFHVQVHTDFHSPEFRGFLNRIRVLLARFVLKRADRIRVVSDRIRSSLQATSYKLQAVPTVLPIYVDIKKFHGAHAGVLAGRFSKFDKRLLVVARLEKEKNVALAIRAFQDAAVAACLIIVGEGRERARLEKRVAQLGLGNRIFFEGYSDPLPYYALADCVLVPSLFEGYGLVIVEALAAGKPVIATDVGVAGEAGAIVTSPEHFADTLKEWCKNGPFVGELQHYPYQSFEEYVAAYAADIRETAL